MTNRISPDVSYYQDDPTRRRQCPMIPFYTNSQAALRDGPGSNKKLLDIPPLQRIMADDYTFTAKYSGKETAWRKVEFNTGSKVVTGYVYDGLLDLITEKYQPVLKIKGATPNPNDGNQYLVYAGQTQYNLCGEMCACFCAGWRELTVEDWLDTWKLKGSSLYSRVFAGGRSRGTGIGEVRAMFDAFEGYEAYILPFRYLSDALKDPLLGRPIMTPERIQAILADYFIIYGCKIGYTGELRGSGVGHWVVIDNIEIEAMNRARVGIYNPFPNCMQDYSWGEIVATGAASMTGLLVPR